MKQSFRVLSIVVALGLLAAAFGVGPLFAGFTDTSGRGTLDASHAPAALVTVDENKVEFASSDGDDISFARPDVMATFFVKDGALESTKAGTAKYTGGFTGAQQERGVTSSIPHLTVANAPVTISSLEASDYLTTSPDTTPLTGAPTVTVDSSTQLVTSFDVNTGVFAIFNALPATNPSIMVTTFNYHFQDSYHRDTSGVRRAKVISTSDPQGEFVTIWEVAQVNGTATTTDAFTGQATTTQSITVSQRPIVDATGDDVVDKDDVAVKKSGGAAVVVTAVDANSGVITLAVPLGGATDATSSVTYRHATRSATSQLFRGNVNLTSNAAVQGTNNDGVWVQDGDTLTVTYMDTDGNAIDTDTITIDGVGPTVSSIAPADGSVINVLNPTITFDVTDTGAGISATAVSTDITVTINGTLVPSTAPAFQAIADGFRVIFAQGASWITSFRVTDSTKFTWAISASDIAGNTKTISGTDLELTIDQTDPDMTAGVTGIAYDEATAAEDTGENTAVRVTFNEDLDSASVSASDFTVGGSAPSDVFVVDNMVYLTVGTLAPDAKPEVLVVAAVSDPAGNSLSDDTVTALDGLDPGLTITIDTGLAVDGDSVKTTVATDEKLAVDGLNVSIFGPNGAVGNGALTMTAPTPTSNEGTFTAGGSVADTGIYGVSISGTDLGSNSDDNLTAVSAEDVSGSTVAGAVSVITLAKGPLADANFDDVLDAGDFTLVATTNGTPTAITAADITVFNASARTLSVNKNIDTAKAVTVSYSYVADNVFEVDNSAPTVTFDPDGTADVENTAPFIRVIFDEDEYPGDTHKTVSLTKAEVTKPDGTTEDVLAKFTTLDNIEYIWAASDLALGDHDLVVSGTDDAGNELADASVTITIAERAPVKIALRPGWNLVSLPGATASSGINSVVTVSAVDVVLTYDPRTAAKWLTAVRNAEDGLFYGSLTEISANTAYWVHTSTFEPIEVDIPGLTAGSAQLPPSHMLVAGWNLVPVSILNPGDADPDADEYYSGLDWSRSYGYDNVTNRFDGFDPGGEEVVAVGKGYWLYLNGSGTLVP